MKVLIVIGTRPEGIKMAPVLMALDQDPTFTRVLVSTGQHKEMLDQVLALFQLTPEYDLQLMTKNQSLSALTQKIILNLDHILTKEKPDIVLVHGDTTTTFCAAYSAFLRQIPIGHVEAGLRTYNKYSPFPEEINRQFVSRVADINFACTESNKANLLNEKVPENKIFVIGNTVIDAFFHTLTLNYTPPPSLKHIFDIQNRLFLVTTHRRENIASLKNIYAALNYAIETYTDIEIVFPVHKNPKIKKAIKRYLNPSPRLHLIETLDYQSFCQLMKRSTAILTDSGGIQEEACSLQIPILITRENTERPEGLASPYVNLVGTSLKKIIRNLDSIFNADRAIVKHFPNPYGDGLTAQRIVKILKNYV